jgi:hypothetical protein
MSKMGSHDPFGYLKHKLWPKQRLGVKLPIWLSTTKSQELPWFIACRWCATCYWKNLDESYNFASDFISIGGLQKTYELPKFWKSQFREFWDSQFESPMTKWHLKWWLPQMQAVVSIMSPCLFVAHSCTKSVSIMH